MNNVGSFPKISHSTEIPLRHGYFPVNLLNSFRTPFPKNTSGGLLLPKNKPNFSLSIYIFFYLSQGLWSPVTVISFSLLTPGVHQKVIHT